MSIPSDRSSDRTAGSATRFILEVDGEQVSIGPEDIVRMVETGAVPLETPVSLSGSTRKAPLRRWIRELVFTADEQNRISGLSEAPYRSLFEVAFDDAPIGIVLSDLSGRIVRSNRAAVEFLGRSADDLTGRAVGELSYGESREEEIVLGNELIAGKIKSFQVEKQFLHSSGAILDAIVGLSILKSTVSRPARVIAHITDTREQKQLEKAAAEAEKHQAISDFAGGLAHDLNNLLTSIISNTALAREAPEEVSDSLRGIDVAVATAERLVGQLQSLDSSASVEPAELDIDQSISATLPLLNSLLPAGAALETSLHCPSMTVMINASQFEQVLLNLVVNAGLSLVDGIGTIRIRTTQTSPREHGAPTLTVEVEDTGEGMSQSLIEQIFQPFFSTRKQAGGTGLGLATVATIVARSGGKISVSSVPNEGSNFKVQWPLFDRSRGDARARGAQPRPRPLEGLRVLIVDDQPDIVRILRRLLHRERCEVVTATSVSHARERLRAQGPFDVVVSDIILDDGQGTDLYLFAQAEEIEGKFVFMSGFGGSHIEDVIGTSDYHFMRKPFMPNDVRAILIQAAGRS